MNLLNKTLLSIVTLIIVSYSAYAKTEIISSTANSLTIVYTPELVSNNVITINGIEYTQPVFDDAGNILEQTGYPQLIATKKAIAVPSPTGYSIQNIEIGPIKSINSVIAPVYLLGREDDTQIDRRAYLNRPIEEWANIEYNGISRDKYSATLNIINAKYNPYSKSIEIPEYVKVTIKFDSKGTKSNRKNQRNSINNSFLNSNVAKNWTVSDEQLFFRNDIEKQTKANKVQSDEVLSSGSWFKIRISETGVYELTAEYLNDFGISIPNNNVNTIKIFGNGGHELPENVDFAALNQMNQQNIIVKKNPDGSLKSIVFFAGGTTGFEYGTRGLKNEEFFNGFKVIHYLNHFSKNNNYLLTWGGDEGKRSIPATAVTGDIKNDLNVFTRRQFFEEELISAYHGGAGKQFFGRTYFSDSFDQDLINLADEGNLTYRLSLAHAGASKSGGQFSVKDNGKLVAENLYLLSTVEEAYRKFFEFTIPRNEVPNKDKISLKLDYTNAGQTNANGIFDYLEIHYPSKTIAHNGEVYMFTDPLLSGLTKYNFTGFNGDVYAYDISDMGNPIQLEAKSQGKFDLITDLTENQPKRFFLSSNLRKPVSIEKVDIKGLRNTKFNNDVIVITHSKLRESAKKFKEYREANSNLSVGIFEITDIYNEYNAGTMDITAVRDFIAQAMTNWDVKPTYVVLWGDGHYDYREILTTQTNFVPPHLSEDEYNSFASVKSICTDDYYARVVGNDKALDLAIGRLTINTEKEGNIIVEKIKHYENNSSIDNWRNKITLVADDGFSGTENPDKEGDGDLFVRHSEDFSNNRVPKFMEQRKIYSVEYESQLTAGGIRKPSANAAILKSVNEEGVLLLNWYGHGNPQVWSHEGILDRDVSIRQMVNYDKLFFLTAATCDFAKYDNFESLSGAELMLLNEYGGSIGVFGSSRVVYATQNHYLNRALYSNLFTRNENGDYLTLGEAVFNLKQTFNSDNDEKYFLLGDPTLRLLIPRYDIVLENINGEVLTDSTSISVKGLQKVKINGYISLPDSIQTLASDFNGQIKLKVMDGDQEVEVIDNRKRLYQFQKLGGTLSNANFAVVNGRFEAEFILPKDISFSENMGKVFSYAFSDDTRFATGSYDKLKIDGLSTSDVSDNEGPEIKIMLDSRKFNPGDLVRNEPLLIVDLSDNSGINSTGIGVGHKIEAWIDNSEQSIDLTSDYETSFDDYRKGTATKNLLGLEPGAHFVKLRAWDIFNNHTIAETYFNIGENGEVVINNVLAYPTPFENNTKIKFKHNLNPPVDVTLDIYDSKGMRVNTLVNKVLTPYEGEIDWEGVDMYGTDVSIGTYYFRLKLDNLIAKQTFLEGRTVKIK